MFNAPRASLAAIGADRAAALYGAFDTLTKDEAFLAGAKKRTLSITPQDAKQVTALVNRIDRESIWWRA